jgi:hypothetical protein
MIFDYHIVSEIPAKTLFILESRFLMTEPPTVCTVYFSERDRGNDMKIGPPPMSITSGAWRSACFVSLLINSKIRRLNKGCDRPKCTRLDDVDRNLTSRKAGGVQICHVYWNQAIKWRLVPNDTRLQYVMQHVVNTISTMKKRVIMNRHRYVISFEHPRIIH